MEPVIVFAAMFATAFGISYYYLFTRNKERLALIQAGADASLFKSPPKGATWSYSLALVLGVLGMGIGLGVFIAFIIEQFFVVQQLQMAKDGLIQYARTEFPQIYVMSIFFFGGLGLVASFYMLRNIRKKDLKN